ncbi:hypothetical protein D3C87_1294310 [compost metagenome]
MLVCFAIAGRNWGINSSTLRKENNYESVIRIARKEIGVRETGGQNCGVAVARYLAYVGFQTPQPWCAALVSYVFKEAGYAQPRTAWSPALFPKDRLVKDPSILRDDKKMPGMVIGIYIPDLKRIGHCGIIERLQGDWCFSIEGNTSLAGSREGDGVYRRVRHKRSIHCYADWIK